MNTYTIDLKVEGLEADPEIFIEFVNYISDAFGRLFNYTQAEDHIFHVQVPSDTNLFMLGSLWHQYSSINKQKTNY